MQKKIDELKKVTLSVAFWMGAILSILLLIAFGFLMAKSPNAKLSPQSLSELLSNLGSLLAGVGTIGLCYLGYKSYKAWGKQFILSKLFDLISDLSVSLQKEGEAFFKYQRLFSSDRKKYEQEKLDFLNNKIEGNDAIMPSFIYSFETLEEKTKYEKCRDEKNIILNKVTNFCSDSDAKKLEKKIEFLQLRINIITMEKRTTAFGVLYKNNIQEEVLKKIIINKYNEIYSFLLTMQKIG